MADPIENLVAAVDELVAADPAVVADGESIVALHRQLERLSAVATRAVGRFDASQEWAADGARSAAAWLSTRCRSPRRTAGRRVGLARALRAMPHAEAAWLGGRIGDAQVVTLRHAQRTSGEAFTRDEQMLVGEAAKLQHRQLERVVAYWRQLNAPKKTEQEAIDDYQARRAHLSPGMRGTGFLDAMFDPIGYDIFERTLRQLENELFREDWAEASERLGGESFSVHDLRRTPAQRRHDALVEMARRARAVPPGARLPEPLFSVHTDIGTAKYLCELANGTVVTPGSLVRWLGEAWIERVVVDGADRTINLGVRRRLFTGGTRRAVEVRYRECYHEFCDVPVEDCEIDHIEPYAAGGLTIDTNGRPACGFHNRLRNQRPRQPEPPEPDDDPP